MLRTVGRGLFRRGGVLDVHCRAVATDTKSPSIKEKEPESSSGGVPTRFRSIAHELSVASELPIERRSLTRGMAINKFEKDFMIYPEYDETEDLELMKSRIEKFSAELDEALAESPDFKEDALTDGVLHVLRQNKIFGSLVSREFGGVGSCQKDLLMMAEVLGRDLSLFTAVNEYQVAANIILLFGSDQQRSEYLPRLATFDCRPAICLTDEGPPTPPTEVTVVPGDDARLNGVKVNVWNADRANVFIVFAKQRQGDIMVDKALIIDAAELTPSEKITIGERTRTQGLDGAHMASVHFTNVRIKDTMVMSDIENTDDVVKELAHGGKLQHGAAVVGFLKRLIGSLCEFATTRIEGNMRLSDTHPAQTAITDLSVGTFVLESMVYYIGGLIDEGLYLLNDVENAIVQRYTNKVLRQAMITVSDVAGMVTVRKDFPYERLIRDIVTLISTTDCDLKLVRSISLPALNAYVTSHDSLPNLMERFTLTKMFNGDFQDRDNFRDPKMVHFIAEHVHPSLEVAARNLENSMARVNQCIDRLLTDKGMFVKQDYYALKELATVLENNLGMVAALARTSRSYSIGLRNADLELAWTIYYCMTAAKQTENILKEVMDFFGLMRLNPSLTALGKTIFDQKGYLLEHPTERNW